MGERKQKGFLTVTLIAVTDCHISSFTGNCLNTKNSDKNVHMNTVRYIYLPLFISLFCHYSVYLKAVQQNKHLIKIKRHLHMMQPCLVKGLVL